ncbi:unnamed protein product [Pleuronectes platessa]|uniref:Uncharacterized protein n=1 Tax=Pleuronectes platessa TaxID=8262 RepID=A0A9N7Y7C4_PLEPL|nr:unnamed protein product [Pleuronectes platessa]
MEKKNKLLGSADDDISRTRFSFGRPCEDLLEPDLLFLSAATSKWAGAGPRAQTALSSPRWPWAWRKQDVKMFPHERGVCHGRQRTHTPESIQQRVESDEQRHNSR